MSPKPAFSCSEWREYTLILLNGAFAGKRGSDEAGVSTFLFLPRPGRLLRLRGRRLGRGRCLGRLTGTLNCTKARVAHMSIQMIMARSFWITVVSARQKLVGPPKEAIEVVLRPRLVVVRAFLQKAQVQRKSLMKYVVQERLEVLNINWWRPIVNVERGLNRLLGRAQGVFGGAIASPCLVAVFANFLRS